MSDPYQIYDLHIFFLISVECLFSVDPFNGGIVVRDSVWVLEELGFLNSRNQPKDSPIDSEALGSRVSSYSGTEGQMRAGLPRGTPLLCGCGSPEAGRQLGLPLLLLGSSPSPNLHPPNPQTQQFPLPQCPHFALLLSAPLPSRSSLLRLSQPGGLVFLG